MKAGDMVHSIGVSALLGGLLGAPIGGFGARARRASRDFERQLSEVDWDNVSLEVRGRDEGVELLLGDKPLRQADGSIGRFSVSDEAGPYRMKEIDGVNYTYQDGVGVIRAADRELDSPAAVGQDIADQFGAAERETVRRMRVDQAGLKADFAKPEWKDDVRALLDDGDNLEDVIRSADDYVNFRTRQEFEKMALPRAAGETAEAFEARTAKPALEQVKASKVGGPLARARGMEWVLEKMQFSPVAKAARVFKGDNVVLDAVTRIGGDYGWAIRSAEFGFSGAAAAHPAIAEIPCSLASVAAGVRSALAAPRHQGEGRRRQEAAQLQSVGGCRSRQGGGAAPDTATTY